MQARGARFVKLLTFYWETEVSLAGLPAIALKAVHLSLFCALLVFRLRAVLQADKGTVKVFQPTTSFKKKEIGILCVIAISFLGFKSISV